MTTRAAKRKAATVEDFPVVCFMVGQPGHLSPAPFPRQTLPGERLVTMHAEHLPALAAQFGQEPPYPRVVTRGLYACCLCVDLAEGRRILDEEAAPPPPIH